MMGTNRDLTLSVSLSLHEAAFAGATAMVAVNANPIARARVLFIIL